VVARVGAPVAAPGEAGAGAPVVAPVSASAAPAQAKAVKARRDRWPLILACLRIIAEAGWITVLYSAASVIVNHAPPVLGPFEMAGFAAIGALIAAWGRSHEEMGPVVLIVAVMLGGVAGWLLSADARALLPDTAAAFPVHLVGWLAGVAVLRGALVSTGPRAAAQLESLMRTVPPALGIIWAYTTFAARQELWLPFAITAMWGTVAFLSAALVGIGIARLNDLHADVADPRERRAWRWLVIGVGFGVVPIAIPVGILSGIPLSSMLSPVVGPAQWLIGLLVIPLSFIVWILSEILRPVAGPLGEFLDELQKRMANRLPPDASEPNTIGTILGLLVWILTIVVVLIAIFVFAQWLLKRNKGPLDELDSSAHDIVRDIVIPVRDVKPATAGRRPRRRGTPHDVVAAYVAALGEMEGDPTYARQPAETPAQHAARIRRAGAAGAPDLARLAAGYQLARYAARPISALENLRALGRFQRIRRAIRS
jgi:hypothetical protein